MPSGLANSFLLADFPQFPGDESHIRMASPDACYVSPTLADSVMTSCTGRIGVKHHADSVTMRSSVLVNGAHHATPLVSNAVMNSIALPREEMVGSVVCCVDGELVLDGELVPFVDFSERRMDMATGLYTCTARAQLSDGSLLPVRFDRLASLHRPSVWAMRFTFPKETPQSATLKIAATVGEGWSADVTPPDLFAATSQSSNVQVYTSVAVQSMDAAGIEFRSPPASDQREGAVFFRSVCVGGGACVEVTLSHSLDGPTTAAGSRFDTLLAEQSAVLSSFWTHHSINVSLHGEVHVGRLSTALRFNSYVLRCAGAGTGRRCGITRSGLTCPGQPQQVNLQSYLFHGIYFTLTEPPVALQMIHYLYSLLPDARIAARSMAVMHGALFPHRTCTGAGCVPFALANCARFQINSDLAYFIFLYVDAVGPQELSEADFSVIVEIILETARFWLSVGMWHDGNTQFCIDDVNGPDEYAGLTRGNMYTHVSARHHMDRAVAVLREFKSYHPAAAEVLLRQLQFTDGELMSLSQASAAIVLHRDDRTGVYFQHENFEDRLPWPTGEIEHPLSYRYHPAVIFRHRVCQLPEVLLALLLYPDTAERSDLRRNLNYYLPLCTHDHPSSLAIVAAAKFRADGDLGNGSSELETLTELNLDSCSSSAAEGLHLSWMSSSWWALIYGVGGFSVVDSCMCFNPCLPIGWERFEFSVVWRGSSVLVAISADAVSYTLTAGAQCRLRHENIRVRLDMAALKSVSIPRGAQLNTASPFDGVIFTVESLITNLEHINFLAWEKVLSRFFEDYDRRRFLGDASSGEPTRPITWEEYADAVLYQRDSEVKTYSGLNVMLAARGIRLDAGCRKDAEIVETLFGLANAKVSEMQAMLRTDAHRPHLAERMMALIGDLLRAGMRVAVVSFTRSLGELISFMPEAIASRITTTVDGLEARERRLRSRPFADIFSHTASKMHMPTNRCVVVGTRMDRDFAEAEVRRFYRWVHIAHDGAPARSQLPLTVSSASDRIPNTTSMLEDWLMTTD